MRLISSPWFRAGAFALLATLLASTSALAQTRYPQDQYQRFAARDAVLSGNLVEVSVIDRTYGQALPVYPWRGRNYIAGRPGSTYQIQLHNTTSMRVMAVVAVDGINVITGRNADPSQVGYVLQPFQTATIDGWRKSQSRVAQFNFTTVPDSYAGRSGRWNQVGVIGVAVFGERLRPQPYPERLPEEYSRDHAGNMESARGGPPAPPPTASAQKSAAEQRSIGTGHGESQYSPVGTTTFLRNSMTPDEVLRLDYDRREVLARRGIIPRYRDDDRDEPEAFPGGYVPDPPRW